MPLLQAFQQHAEWTPAIWSTAPCSIKCSAVVTDMLRTDTVKAEVWEAALTVNAQCVICVWAWPVLTACVTAFDYEKYGKGDLLRSAYGVVRGGYDVD